MAEMNCSVTVMPVFADRIGFLRREPGDTFGGLLVAPGGKVELTDGKPVDGVPYNSAEAAGARELLEETGIEVRAEDLVYFCSLTLPRSGRMVLSYYCVVGDSLATQSLEWLTSAEILRRVDFAPGMRDEALLLLDKLRKQQRVAQEVRSLRESMVNAEVGALRQAVDMRPEVLAFAQHMESVLKDNDHKGGWTHSEPSYLLGRLVEEVGELVIASTRSPAGFQLGSLLRFLGSQVHEGDPSDWGVELSDDRTDTLDHSVGLPSREAADVGDFAMMIADRSHGIANKIAAARLLLAAYPTHSS